MVPEQTREGEESCQQIKNHQLVFPPLFSLRTTRVGYKLILSTHILTLLDPRLNPEFLFFFLNHAK